MIGEILHGLVVTLVIFGAVITTLIVAVWLYELTPLGPLVDRILAGDRGPDDPDRGEPAQIVDWQEWGL